MRIVALIWLLFLSCTTWGALEDVTHLPPQLAALREVDRSLPREAIRQKIEMALKSLQSFDDFPVVDEGDLTGLSEIPRAQFADYEPVGFGFLSLRSGFFKGEPIFIKEYNPKTRTSKHALNEARWLWVLNQFGIGARFIGLIPARPSDQAPSLVTELVPGIHVSQDPFEIQIRELIRAHPHSLDPVLDSILQLGTDLYRLGIDWAFDIQIRVTPIGQAVLIDPDLFELKQHPLATSDGRVTRLLAIREHADRSAQGERNCAADLRSHRRAVDLMTE